VDTLKCITLKLAVVFFTCHTYIEDSGPLFSNAAHWVFGVYVIYLQSILCFNSRCDFLNCVGLECSASSLVGANFLRRQLRTLFYRLNYRAKIDFRCSLENLDGAPNTSAHNHSGGATISATNQKSNRPTKCNKRHMFIPPLYDR
jgi:hypothetical protein